MRTILFFVIMQLISNFVIAQIQGDIVDQNNKGLPSAIIIATDSLRNFTDTVKSDSRGFYSFTSLKPGKYKIQVKAIGFKPLILQNILVRDGETGIIGGEDLYNGQRLDISLAPLKSP